MYSQLYALCFQLTDLATKLKEIGEKASDGKLLMSYAYSVLLPEVSISSVSIIFFVTCILKSGIHVVVFQNAREFN